MSLPDLPKQYKTREAAFGLKLRKWLATNPIITCTIETKQTKTDSIPFSEVAPEQVAFGMAVKSDKGVLVRVQGMSGESDYIYLRNEPAFVVIKYPTSFHFIDMAAFILERDRSKRRSLTSARARAISTISV